MQHQFYRIDSETQELFTTQFLRLSSASASVKKAARKYGLLHGTTTTHNSNGPSELQHWRAVQVFLDVPKKHKRTPGQRAAVWGMALCFVITAREAAPDAKRN